MSLERKTDSYLKDIIRECWIELGCDFMGTKRNSTFCQNEHGTRTSHCGLQQSVIGKETPPSFCTPKSLKIKEMF